MMGFGQGLEFSMLSVPNNCKMGYCPGHNMEKSKYNGLHTDVAERPVSVKYRLDLLT